MIVTLAHPEFLPYAGYWNRIKESDVVVYLDTIKFKHRHYHNRAKIKSSSGWKWFTIPVSYKNADTIQDVRVSSFSRFTSDFNALSVEYGESEFCSSVLDSFSYILDSDYLIDINFKTFTSLLQKFNWQKKIIFSSDLPVTHSEDIVFTTDQICSYLNADYCIIPIGSLSIFKDKDLHLRHKYIFQDFVSIPYPQFYTGWIPRLSVLDCILLHGWEYADKIISCGWNFNKGVNEMQKFYVPKNADKEDVKKNAEKVLGGEAKIQEENGKTILELSDKQADRLNSMSKESRGSVASNMKQLLTD